MQRPRCVAPEHRGAISRPDLITGSIQPGIDLTIVGRFIIRASIGMEERAACVPRL